MRFVSRTGGDAPAMTVDTAIRCFEYNGESGPHSSEGWLLSHILNHCAEKNVPFSLIFVPDGGYYVKRGSVKGIAPDVILNTLQGKS